MEALFGSMNSNGLSNSSNYQLSPIAIQGLTSSSELIREITLLILLRNGKLPPMVIRGITTSGAKKERKEKDEHEWDLLELFPETEKKHYEERTKLNGEHPTYDEVKENPEWTLLSEGASKYHDDGDEYKELKYITEDGREAVFDGYTHEIETDPRYMATYNYVPPKKMEDCENIGEYIEAGLGHFKYDMMPYYMAGWDNVRD